MISEELQDQAALYALDLLSAAEDAAFERELVGNTELQSLVHELRDAAGAMALSATQSSPPAALKARVMQQIATEPGTPARFESRAPKISPFLTWIPWAIAAALAIFCGVLAVDRAQLQKRLAAQSETAPVLVVLAPSEGAPADATAVVAWHPDQQNGVIKIKNLPAAATGKDYQLWAVDAAHKDPISAGILRITDNGAAEIRFQPREAAREVQAFAISLEREGGVPKKEGPIVLVGKI